MRLFALRRALCLLLLLITAIIAYQQSRPLQRIIRLIRSGTGDGKCASDEMADIEARLRDMLEMSEKYHLRFQRQNGGSRPLVESEPPLPAQSPLLDGSRARYLCGTRCIIAGDVALNHLLAHQRAVQTGQAQAFIEAQTRAYLERIR